MWLRAAAYPAGQDHKRQLLPADAGSDCKRNPAARLAARMLGAHCGGAATDQLWARQTQVQRLSAAKQPACELQEQLAEVMREADRRGYIIVNSCMEQKYGTEFWRPDLFAMLTAVQQGRVNAVMVQSLDRLSHDLTTLYRILRFLQNYGTVLITTETNLQYELYLTGLESRLLNRPKKRKPVLVCEECEDGNP